MTVRSVTIGDQFIAGIDRKRGIVSTVVDFLETRSLVTGEVTNQEVVAEKIFCGQIIRFKTPFCSVLIRKVESKNV